MIDVQDQPDVRKVPIDRVGVKNLSYPNAKIFVLGVDVLWTTLCPYSKELSGHGAHDQCSVIRVRVRYMGFVWIEELIKIAEASASSPLYALLKRKDEKAVIEHAYDHPMFCEDGVREAAVKLNADSRILWYSVESENIESIHNHNEYAKVERVKNGGWRSRRK